MSKLLRWLLGSLSFSIVDDDGVGTDPEGDPEGDAEEGADPEGADPEGEEGTDPDADPDDREQNIKALRQTAKRAKEEARTERDARIASDARLSALEARMNGGGAPANREAELPADADATTRFVFEGNKQLKNMAQKVDYATFKAEDAADRAEYYSKAPDDPLINKYRVRVEAKYAELVKQGQRVPREAILTFLIGGDVREGKGPKATPSKAATEAATRVRAATGKPGSVRSDASGKERKSESEQRRKRLENVEL